MKRRKGDLRPHKEALRRIRVLAAKIPNPEALAGFLSHVPPPERAQVAALVVPHLKF